MEETWVRSMPGRKNIASVTCFSTVKNLGVNMSPSRAVIAITTRSAPPNSSRCLRKVCMYSCLSGTSLKNPASTRSCAACHPITMVTSAKAASTRTRRPKRQPSMRAVSQFGEAFRGASGMGGYSRVGRYSGRGRRRTPNSPVSSTPPSASASADVMP